MKIVKSSGCTAYYTSIENKDLDELTSEEKEALCNRLFTIFKKSYGINDAINTLLDNIEYDGESGGHCDQCGDSVYRQKYDLDELEKDLGINGNESSRQVQDK